MKSKLLTAALVTAALIALVTCDTGASPLSSPVSPITFFGTWETDTDSVNTIVRGPRTLEVRADWSFVYTGGEMGTLIDTVPGTLGAGGFSQAKQELGNLSSLGLGSNVIYYPPIIVEGMLIYVGDGYYDFAPRSGRIDSRILRKLKQLQTSNPYDDSIPAYIELPDSTVQIFREYAKISFNGVDSAKLDMIDNPNTITGGIGFLEGTWELEP